VCAVTLVQEKRAQQNSDRTGNPGPLSRGELAIEGKRLFGGRRGHWLHADQDDGRPDWELCAVEACAEVGLPLPAYQSSVQAGRTQLSVIVAFP
jgi:hypothetical protein